jgi:hypothetical protein
MDVQIIGLWVGLAITFVLGLINFLWGGGVLSRRGKVSARETEVDTGMVLQQKNRKPVLWVKCKFKLVRTSGDQDLYVESAYVELNKEACKNLDQYILLPPDNRVYWGESYHEVDSDKTEQRKLRINEPKEFTIFENFFLLDSLLKVFDEEEHEGKVTRPEITENIMRLRFKLKIAWKDGGGKEWQYRIPEKWWNRLLPERLWWKTG